jgi:hypothetical protein
MKVGEVIEVPAGATRRIDLSSARGTVVEGDGATATVHLIDSLEGSPALEETVAISGATELPRWPFVQVASAGGTTFVGVLRF